jgi:hypothetical protein
MHCSLITGVAVTRAEAATRGETGEVLCRLLTEHATNVIPPNMTVPILLQGFILSSFIQRVIHVATSPFEKTRHCSRMVKNECRLDLSHNPFPTEKFSTHRGLLAKLMF